MHVRHWLVVSVLAAASALAAPVPAWVQESDALAQPMLKTQAQFSPEGAQKLGVEGVDDKTVDLGPRPSCPRPAIRTCARTCRSSSTAVAGRS